MIVKVYSSNSCPWCVKAKNYLKKKRVKFEEINISNNRIAAAEMLRKSGQKGVPVIDIDGKIIVGFNKEEIDKLLGE